MTERASGKRDFDELERRRMKAVKLFQQGLSQAEVARRLNVARESVRRWWNRLAAHGSSEGLKRASRPGRKPRLTDAQLKQLRTILRAGPAKSGFAEGSWTLKRIAKTIAERFGVDYHVRHISWILRNKLDWSLRRSPGAKTPIGGSEDSPSTRREKQPKQKRATRDPRSRKR
jgi:transposase